MKMLLQEWLQEGRMSSYCQSCVHFLAQAEPRIVKQPVIYPSDCPTINGVRFVDTFKSTPVCNECFYHDDGTPSNFCKER